MQLGSPALLPFLVPLGVIVLMTTLQILLLVLGGISLGLDAEVGTADVIYQFMDEFIEAVDRLQGTLDAASRD